MDTPQNRPVVRLPKSHPVIGRLLAFTAMIAFVLLTFEDHQASHFGWLLPLGLALLAGSFCV